MSKLRRHWIWWRHFWIERRRLLIQWWHFPIWWIQWWHFPIKWLGDHSGGVTVLFDIPASIGTLTAAVLAAVTIRQAKRQAKASQEALLLERQVDFRLDLLKEIASFNLRGSHVAYADEEIRQRATMLPIELVPLTRAAVGLESTDDAKDVVAAKGYRDRSMDDIADELLRAATTTLEARSINGVSQPSPDPELQRRNCRD